MNRFSSTSAHVLICLFLMFMLSIPESLRPAFAETTVPPALNIVIVEGEGAINNVKQRTARETIIQVEDGNHRPVAGAAVVFTLPDKGPGGTFAKGSRVLRVTSDSHGRAAAKGLRLNNVSGKFQIRVDASFQGSNASTTISQTNAVLSAASSAGSSVAQILSVVLSVGASAAAVVYVTTRENGKVGKRNPTTGQER